MNSTSGRDNYKDKALPQNENEKKTGQIHLNKDIFFVQLVFKNQTPSHPALWHATIIMSRMLQVMSAGYNSSESYWELWLPAVFKNMKPFKSEAAQRNNNIWPSSLTVLGVILSLSTSFQCSKSKKCKLKHYNKLY